ncbi:relaxase/mobilization nuclease domain-containing protein [Epibacterium ulvae]|nr:relaxase/mobilization nuclease domain-containing protein [Epibacterium ulvae]MBT8156151.1 relaxase/mobilization nuclease domain-containing protein [Epibacterium ulvae]
MVKVTKPAKIDRSGKTIVVNRQSEGVRVTGHFDYISRNGKLEIETADGQTLSGKSATGQLAAEWLVRHDEDRHNGFATGRTRITTNMVFSMPADVNAEGIKDAVRALAEDEFGGRHDYVMALHTDTKHPHVHLTVRTVGHDGIKLNLRKADLQHLRSQFAQRLRQRGIDAEATPRHARGVTRKSQKMPVYKVRQKGQLARTDEAKREEARRDMQAHGGRLPDYPWDNALMSRRNRVIGTYMKAATALALSDDPEDRALARDTQRYAAQLTDLRTERVQIASDARLGCSEGLAPPKGPVRERVATDRAKDADREPQQGPGNRNKDRER